MVIAGSSRQLFKTRRNVSFSKNFPFGSTVCNVSHKNYSAVSLNSAVQRSETFVRLWCSCRSLHFSKETTRSHLTKLTPQEVDSVLRANEYTKEFKEGSVKSYDSNQLPSNNPIEDTRSEASCLLTTGFLVGVFDGHGGGACAQVIAKRLFNYITACLLPHDILTQYQSNLNQPKPPDLIEPYNDKVQFVEDVRDIYKESFTRFIKELAEEGFKHHFDMSGAIERAFLKLDDDLSREAMPVNGKVNLKTLSVAMSGAVSCVAHIDGPHLHVASVGDCCAVLGSLSETDSWIAKKLNEEHNAYNSVEYERILSEHPKQEQETVINMGRLLGQLAPLRAMGDFRFKWKKEIIVDLVAKHFGDHMIPPFYHTPPYLSATPDVAYHRLTPRDKFLIIATDGLWDCVTPLEFVLVNYFPELS
ncbi:pyruvate dehydrogenase [acetyl-transferring]-phosphatase 1-like protein, mitochondrial isoform X2 [Rhynchophorus ferrugineus]|uniref:pyruvate dehydrogenase [acetyl-transferring]-phosphatase 1-like protein, mitochondrial isoform X2 n=1 Tax=Rhynchophorus ferrugineus TaxID=354439 RepID=UPI003FCE1D3C